MRELFGLTEQQASDMNVIKFIDGIAGCGKTTSVIDFFGPDIKIFGPTNRNVASTSQRFGIKAQTTASGLFKTINGKYYAEERPMEGETIVIDELLLTSPRVWDYIRNYRNNYILLTDSRQMLPPHTDTLKHAREALQELPNYYIRLENTKRAVNEKTLHEYNRGYAAAAKDIGYNIRKDIETGRYPVIDARDMIYKPDVVYIVHTNEHEKRLYKRFHDEFIEKTPKALAARETDANKIDELPLLCQKDAERMHARKYAQVSNIATPTRFQGCETAGEIYYIIDSKSSVSTREFYTTITRAKDLEKFTIVIDDVNNDSLKYYMGCMVKKEAKLRVSQKDLGNISIADTCKMKNQSTEFHFDSHRVIIKETGEEYDYNKNVLIEEQERGPRGLKCKTLINNEDGINFGVQGMTEVYRILEKHGLDKIRRPLLKSFGPTAAHTHNVDMYSCFPHLLHYNRFPVDSVLYKDYSPEHMNFYLYMGNYITRNSLVTDEVKNCFAPSAQERDFVFLFGTDWKQGTKMGKKTLEKSLRSTTAKEQVKKIRWGLLSTPFLKKQHELVYVREKIQDGPLAGKTKLVETKRNIYVKDESATYELFGIALYSHALALMIEIIKAGNIEHCHTVIDGLFYEGDDDTDAAVIKYIESTNYRARLYHGYYTNHKFNKGEILWKNYRELTKMNHKIEEGEI